MDLGFGLGDLGLVEVREVFSVNGGNTFRVSLDKPRLSILKWVPFDTPSFCQMDMFRQVETMPADFLSKQVESDRTFTCPCQVKVLDTAVK